MKKEVKIEKIVFGGSGLGRIEGQVVFVENTLEDEIVLVDTIEKKGFLEGKLCEILSPSKLRLKPDCSYSNICGGCDFRHTNYDNEISLKISMLKDTFLRIGNIDLNNFNLNIIKSPNRNRYRVKSKFQYKNNKFGFYKKKSNTIIDIKSCLNLPDFIDKLIPEIKTSSPFFIESHLFDDKYFRYKKISNVQEQKYIFDNYVFIHKPGNFIQANRFLIKEFINVVEKYSGFGGNLVELYSGSGFFTLPLSFNFDSIKCYEISKNAVNCLNNSLKINNIKNINSFVSDCKNLNFKNTDTIVLDPPREGCEKKLTENINNSKAKNIVYVSCNASTLARDLKRLDNYILTDLTLIDMFPATSHFETVVKLIHKELNI